MPIFEHLTFFAIALVVVLFAAILGCLELGRGLGRREEKDEDRSGTGAVEAAVFGFMGLLLAFTFSGAIERWAARRAIAVEETNIIGTAWLRIDLLTPPAQAPLRELFRSYTDSRIGMLRALPDIAAARAQLDRSLSLQTEIWSYSTATCLAPDNERARLLLLPALNEMIDITTTRTMSQLTHPPMAIYGLLVLSLLASSLIAGFAMSAGPHRRWVHMLCFSAVMSVGMYVIIDLEFPRAGLIRIDAVDQALIELRATMN